MFIIKSSDLVVATFPLLWDYLWNFDKMYTYNLWYYKSGLCELCSYILLNNPGESDIGDP